MSVEEAYEARLGSETVKFVKDILAMNSCPLFFPTSVVRRDGGETTDENRDILIYFFTDGFQPVRDLKIESPFYAAELLYRIAEEIMKAENYYIRAGGYVIDENTVFVRKKGERTRLKMVYEPSDTEKRERNPLDAIAEYLFKDVLLEYREYMEEVRNMLKLKENMKNTVRKLAVFRRKMYAL